MWFADRLSNLVSGLGTSKDKRVALQHGLALIDDAELNAMHRSDWLARKIIDIIPNDMTREWRDWQADGKAIEAIEAIEKAPSINLPAKVNAALKKARLLGGAGIYIGLRNANPAEPLDPETVRQGDLVYLHVLTRREAIGGELVADVESEFFGQPSYYEVSNSAGRALRIHPSRMVRFIGAEVLDSRFQDMQGWGDSVLQGVYDAITNAASVQAHTASLIPEAKTDVIYIPGLSEHLKNETTTRLLTSRFGYANQMKSMFNMLLLEGNGQDGSQGAGEKWEQKELSFGQLPELLQQFLQLASGAADIPVTRLLGQSPAGMNATGESDIRNYYDNIAARQRTELSPALHRLDEVLIRSATGSRDPSIYYEWGSLYGLSDTERATIFKTKVDAIAALAVNQIIPIEPLADAAVNMIVEDGSLPGLDASVDEYLGLLAGGYGQQPPEDDAAAAMLPGRPGGQVTTDAAPRTLYVRRDVLNRVEIVRWAKSQGFTDIVPDLHVTIAYSTAPVDWFAVGTSWSEKLEIAAGGPRQMDRLGPDGRYIALLITAGELVWRNREIREAGASWDWPEYQPHISIQIGGEIDLAKVEPYQGRIVLGPEIFEEVDDERRRVNDAKKSHGHKAEKEEEGTGRRSFVGSGYHNHFDPAQPRGYHGKWIETGVEEKAAAKKALTEAQLGAIRDYTGEGYKAMNWQARGVRPETPEVTARIKALDDALDGRTLDEEAELYRGIGGIGAKEILARKLKKGQIIRDAGFMSTSRSFGVAASFARQSRENFIMEILAPKGTKAFDVSPYSANDTNEQEVLFPRNAAMRVVKWDAKRRVLTVEAINE